MKLSGVRLSVRPAQQAWITTVTLFLCDLCSLLVLLRLLVLLFAETRITQTITRTSKSNGTFFS